MLCGFSSLWWPFGWNCSYLAFLGIIWRTCGSKCRGEGGGIFLTLCVECCLVRHNHSGRKIPILSWRSSCYINHDELVVFIIIWAVLSGVIMCIHYHAYNPVNCTASYIPACMTVNSLWPSDAIWRQGSRSTLVQAMACCLTAPSHCLNQCWLTITKVKWCSSEGNFAWYITAICHWN